MLEVLVVLVVVVVVVMIWRGVVREKEDEERSYIKSWEVRSEKRG
jgi:uncharacterized membrane protein YqiK